MNMHRHIAVSKGYPRSAILAAALLFAGAFSAQAAADAPGIVASPEAPLKADDRVGPIVLSKMPALQVLDLLQTYSGRVIIPAAGLPSPTLTFKSTGKLRRDEAILAIETLLNLNGIMLIPQDDKFIQAVPHAQVLRRGPTLLEGGAIGGEGGQQVYGRVFELGHMDSRTIYLQVRNLISSGGLATILNLEWRNALLIFDTAHNLDSVGEVIEMLDQPTGRRAEVFILPVKNSTVTSVYYALIHAQRYRANGALFTARFHVDRAANHIVAVAPPDSKAYIEELVETLDREIAPLTTSQIFKIRKGDVRTVYNILRGIIRHQQSWFSRQGFRSPEIYRITQDLPGMSAGPAEGGAPGADAA
ncbi:MAG: hypothetical protein U9P12_08280, partial [Verrucomicrobiota bacterium]|nr:hypothetical protein [Verrucomicrobiota bacterium]